MVLRVVLQSTLSSRATLQLPTYLFIVWGKKTPSHVDSVLFSLPVLIDLVWLGI